MVAYDILVLGATGFTGRLVTRYLYNHKQRPLYSFALGARSPSKLDALVQELSLDASVKRVQVDVLNEESVDNAVKEAKVVINTVGPFYRWGTPVVAACARHGVHYVDITAEAPWIKDIIEVYDSQAKQSKAIIIPACGLDCIPSDLVVHLSNRTLKSISPDLEIDTSTSAYNVRMGISGGTVASLVTVTDEIPWSKSIAAMKDYSCSPVQGSDVFRPKLYYQLPHTTPSVYGAVWHMGLANRAMVQRTWGLKEQAVSAEGAGESSKKLRYGPNFKYDEFHIKANPVTAILFNLGLVLGVSFIALFKPIRWLLRKFGEDMNGPSEETMKNGILEVTNVTSSVATPTQPSVHVRSFLRGKGDPGFLVTSVMISETALALLLSHKDLPPLGKQGGITTTGAACGDILINRLAESGWFEFESEIVGRDSKKEI